MNTRHLAWLLLAAGAVIWFVESSKGEFLFSWESSLPGSGSLGAGLGEYLLAGGAALFIYRGA